MDNEYLVKVYVKHGYFQYAVGTMEQAIAHAQVIMESNVYRRVTENNELEFHKPYKVKVCGKEITSEYMDEFHRT